MGIIHQNICYSIPTISEGYGKPKIYLESLPPNSVREVRLIDKPSNIEKAVKKAFEKKSKRAVVSLPINFT